MGPKTHFLLLCFSSPGWLCSFWIFSILFFFEKGIFSLLIVSLTGYRSRMSLFYFSLFTYLFFFFFLLNIFSLLCFGSILSHVARDFFLLRSLGLWLLIRVLNARQCLFLITEVPSTTFVKNKNKITEVPCLCCYFIFTNLIFQIIWRLKNWKHHPLFDEWKHHLLCTIPCVFFFINTIPCVLLYKICLFANLLYTICLSQRCGTRA